MVFYFALIKATTSSSLSRDSVAIVILSDWMLTCLQESTCHDLKMEYKHAKGQIHRQVYQCAQ